MPGVRIKTLISIIFIAIFAALSCAEINPVSLPYLIQKKFDGRELRLGKVLERNKSYTRYSIGYKSGDLKILGIMNVPKGSGPFPVIITCHGFIPPAVYTSGRGLKREQDYLARGGYVVLHPDYRNYNGSDKDPDNDLKLNIGYTEDVINAAYAVKNSSFKFIVRDKIGILGHSLGGGIALNIIVSHPELIKACVLFAPVSSDYKDNFRRWNMRSDQRRHHSHRSAQQIIAKYGSPEVNPEFWNNLSAANFIEQITAPVMLHQGTFDHSVPPEWSAKLAGLLKEHRKNIFYFTYPGEDHEFIKAWPLVMRRTIEFYDQVFK
jgi:dipeptidyl aminopeptidase/acylaminoacyl peptidase